MAKAPKRALKVFQAQLGFYDTVVAVPSQAAALRAWGTRQNLFAGGHARPAEDPIAVEAARARPGVVLRRAIGSRAPFAVETTSLPDLPKPSKDATHSSAPPKAKPKPKPKPKVSRRRLDAAEAALQRLKVEREREESRLAHRQDQLDRERIEARSRFVGRRAAAASAVERLAKPIIAAAALRTDAVGVRRRTSCKARIDSG